MNVPRLVLLIAVATCGLPDAASSEQSKAYKVLFEFATSSQTARKLTPIADPPDKWRCGHLGLTIHDHRPTKFLYANEIQAFTLSDLSQEIRWQAKPWFEPTSHEVLSLSVVHARLFPNSGTWTLNVIVAVEGPQPGTKRRYRGEATSWIDVESTRPQQAVLREAIQDLLWAIAVGENKRCVSAQKLQKN